MIFSRAQALAESVVTELSPSCERIEIAGSIRRKQAEPKEDMFRLAGIPWVKPELRA